MSLTLVTSGKCPALWPRCPLHVAVLSTQFTIVRHYAVPSTISQFVLRAVGVAQQIQFNLP